MKNLTLPQLKKLFNHFEDFARYCFNYGEILIDLRTEHTRETYFKLGKFYTVVESDNGKVEKISYHTEKPLVWNYYAKSKFNVIKQLE